MQGLKHINDVGKDEDADKVLEDEAEKKDVKEGEESDDDEWTADELQNDLDDLIKSDYTSLLLEHEEHIRSPPADGSVRESSCLPIFCVKSSLT